MENHLGCLKLGIKPCTYFHMAFSHSIYSNFLETSKYHYVLFHFSESFQMQEKNCLPLISYNRYKSIYIILKTSIRHCCSFWFFTWQKGERKQNLAFKKLEMWFFCKNRVSVIIPGSCEVSLSSSVKTAMAAKFCRSWQMENDEEASQRTGYSSTFLLHPGTSAHADTNLAPPVFPRLI